MQPVKKLIVCPDTFTSSLWPLSWVIVLKSACIQELANGLKVKQTVDKDLFYCLGGLKVIIQTEGLTFVLKDTKCCFFWTASDLYAFFAYCPCEGCMIDVSEHLDFD